jgi:hypothetical protein
MRLPAVHCEHCGRQLRYIGSGYWALAELGAGTPALCASNPDRPEDGHRPVVA